MAPSSADRLRGPLGLAIKRPVGVCMVVCALLTFGVVGLLKLPITLLPDLAYPSITVRTAYPGASPADVEDRVSEPIREAVSVLSGVTRVTSVSRPAQSDIIIEFVWGTPMLHAVGDIREKLDRVFMPRGAEKPLILRYDPSLDPILTIGLSGDASDLAIRDFAEDEFERELVREEGVAAVKVKGGDEKEILIAIDPSRLSAMGLDITEVARQIGAENLNASAGILEEAQTEYLVRALNEFKSLEDVRTLIIARRNNINIYLKEIARVYRSVREKEVITRIDGKTAVLIEVFKKADANLVDLAGRLETRLFGTREQREYVKSLGGRKTPPLTAEKKKEKGKGKRGEKSDSPQARHKALTDFIAFRLPRGVKARILANPATYISNSIAEVVSSAVFGGFLAILVIYLFLRAGRPTLLISLAIPISLLITFAPLHQWGVTLNVMSLGGLALGVGMLVDSSIVVLESISRRRELGDDLLSAAFNGVSEVSSAVIASTLTTVAVFLPIVFVEGVAGQLFHDQALAVVFSLVAALGVSLFLIPTLAARLSLSLGGDRTARSDARETGQAFARLKQSWAGYSTTGKLLWFWFPSLLALCTIPLSWFCAKSLLFAMFMLKLLALGTGMLLKPLAWLFNCCYAPIATQYPVLLRTALKHRFLVLGFALLLGAFAAYRAPELGSEVIPTVHEGEFEALIFLPRKVDVERTDAVAKPIEEKIRKIPKVASTFLTSGTARDELRSSEEGKHSARIHIVLEPGTGMEAAEQEVRDAVRKIIDEVASVQNTRFQTPTLFSVRTPVSIEVLGHDLDLLLVMSRKIEKLLEGVPSLRDISTTLHRGNTEVVLRFDRERLAAVNLDIGDATRRLSTMVQGEVPTRFSEKDKKVDMRVRLDPEKFSTIRALRQVNLARSGETPLLLSSVADLEFVEGPSEIRRLGSRRGAEIRATIKGLDLGSVQQEIQAKLDQLVVPEGMEIRLGGQREEMERNQSSMLEALFLAIFLVYVVMAAQFESLIQPIIIIVTVPLALIGVVFGLDLLGFPISVVVFIGAIMLAGIVVNNAIVLLDRINQERAAGLSIKEAIIRGSSMRLRPVLMTTLTTVLGLLPLTGALPSLPWLGAYGEGVELRAPMAVTVIAGLSFSTLLTLFVIPLVYSILVRERSPLPPLDGAENDGTVEPSPTAS